MPNFSKNILVWVAAGILLVVVFNLFQPGIEKENQNKLIFSEFLTRVENGEVTDVKIQEGTGKGATITGKFADGAAFITQAPDYPALVERLSDKGVNIAASGEDGESNLLWNALISWFPIFLLLGVYVFFMRQMQSGKGGGAMGFGRSRAKMLTENKERVTFNDVAGIDEARDELQEIVEFLKEPEKFQKLGAQIPRGCLLVGPPGTGKTLLARAIAGEARVPFFTISGSDFVEMFVGVGASRVRDMFEQGKKHAPCIIFIDEIDAVGRHRGAGTGGGNDEREQTLNQLLVEMDGFEANESVIIIAATNRPDVLDQALLRPGRFDRQVTVPNPDINGREKILEVHLKKVPKGPDIDPRVIARGTPGFSGADLANLVNESALLAARRGKKVITMKELEEAKDKIMMGAERKSMVMSDEEKKMTAFHEAGHAIVALHCPASDPIHKATIIPRGRALGMVMRLPEADKISYLRDKMYADLAVAMGGRAAEEIIFGHDRVSSGASSDIQYATKLSRAMVMEWGMSDKVGPLRMTPDEDRPVWAGKPISEDTAAVVDEEVRRIVEESLAHARTILTENMEQLHTLTQGLLDYETLSGDEIKDLLAGKGLNRAGDAQGDNAPVTRSGLPSSRRGGDNEAPPTA